MTEDYETIVVCECCMLKLANDDTSACKDFWNHEHEPCSRLTSMPLLSTGEVREWHLFETWQCWGCGDNVSTDIYEYAHLNSTTKI